ncbi:hypothetical protein H6G41_05265 [Tolypothrix sp. FACHB-123]|nr:hypothetical protein [Tolypothrix sp. FACHB-123]MBD2354035.1 hypothetical protein [Tolypothrix sp. FACHB-123]
MPNAQCPLTIYVLSTTERSLHATSYHQFTYLNWQSAIAANINQKVT